MIEAGLESPYAERLATWERKPEDEARLTTRVESSRYFAVRDQALLAHATQIDPEGPWFSVPLEIHQRAWPTEDYQLVRSTVDSELPEDDLFAGLAVPADGSVESLASRVTFMMLLEVDPNLVRPGWTPLLVIVVLGVVLFFLGRSMLKQFGRIDVPADHPGVPADGVSQADQPPGPTGSRPPGRRALHPSPTCGRRPPTAAVPLPPTSAESPVTAPRPPGMHDVAEGGGGVAPDGLAGAERPPSVRPETRERVQAAITQLGYRRNPFARALVTRRTHTIGVLAPASNLFGPASLVIAVEQAARSHGWYVSLASLSDFDPPSVAAAIDHFLGQQVDGLVVVAPVPSAVEACSDAALGVPTVMVATDAEPADGFDVVAIDQELGPGRPSAICSTSGTAASPTWPGRPTGWTRRPGCGAGVRSWPTPGSRPPTCWPVTGRPPAATGWVGSWSPPVTGRPRSSPPTT